MALAIIERRVEREAQAAKRREQGTTLFLPKETFIAGQPDWCFQRWSMPLAR